MSVVQLTRTAALGLALAVALGACASSAGPTNQPGGPAYDPAGSPTLPTTSATAGADVTLSGKVIQGAEPSCLILRTTSGDFELMTSAQPPRAGDQVTATGHVVHVNSHCMQGTPFQVTSLKVN